MKIMIIITVLIILISVNAALSTLNAMVAKYMECRNNIFSETPQCNAILLGKTINSGMMLLGLLGAVSVISAFVLINSASKCPGAYSGRWST